MIRHRSSWSVRSAAMATLAALLLHGVNAFAQVADKEAAHARMGELTQLARQARAAGDVAAASAARAELTAISAAMGGDLPAAQGEVVDGALLGGGFVVPPPPLGMSVTTTSETNNTPIAIVDVGVISSTVLISGAGSYLWDVDLQTFITHTFAADLDITLMSPAGTVVTLTTDNGAGNDDVFNGTVWDDQANPGGQVPYVSNNGLVTDHVYANLVLASPLVPEEAMAAFKGEDPNGTWTLTISDDLAGDVGSLNQWTLHVHTLPSAPAETVTTVNNNSPVTIPTGPAVVSSTVEVAGAGTRITNVRLTTTMPHTFAADLDVTLMSPAGTVATLTTDNGAGNDDVFAGTLWDDKANPGGQVPYVTNNGLTTDHAYVNLTLASPLVPEEAMGAFLGEDPNGTWTITISDDLAGDGGELTNWTLEVTTGVIPCELTCPGDIGVSNDAGQCGAVVNYPAPTVGGDCGVVTCGPASGSFFPVGGTGITCTSDAGPSCGFNVDVSDTEPPVLGACPSQLAAATSATGAVVNFALPTASDNCPGIGTVNCAPPSGSTFPIGVTADSCTVSDAVGNSANCGFDVQVEAPDVGIVKTAVAPSPLTPGSIVVFTVTVTNNNALVAATGVVVTDPIAADLSYQSNSCGASFAAGVVTWNVGTLAPLAQASCDITVVVIGNSVSNSASVTSATFDPNAANDSTVLGVGFVARSIPVLGLAGLLLLIGLVVLVVRKRLSTATHD